MQNTRAESKLYSQCILRQRNGDRRAFPNWSLRIVNTYIRIYTHIHTNYYHGRYAQAYSLAARTSKLFNLNLFIVNLRDCPTTTATSSHRASISFFSCRNSWYLSHNGRRCFTSAINWCTFIVSVSNSTERVAVRSGAARHAWEAMHQVSDAKWGACVLCKL